MNASGAIWRWRAFSWWQLQVPAAARCGDHADLERALGVDTIAEIDRLRARLY
jgi:hypothetical protein